MKNYSKFAKSAKLDQVFEINPYFLDLSKIEISEKTKKKKRQKISKKSHKKTISSSLFLN